jgi:hypothetical protein
MENIVNGSLYMECEQCNKVFLKKYLEEWFNNSKTCPHCRIIWTSNKVYKNVDDNPKIYNIPTDDDIINDIINNELQDVLINDMKEQSSKCINY